MFRPDNSLELLVNAYGPLAGKAQYHLELKPSAAKRVKLDYLALGDSYTSGEGDIGKDKNGMNYYLPLTDMPPETCHISSRSYPFLLQKKWGIISDKMHSVACSGAKVTTDYFSPLMNYRGQDGRLSNNKDIQKAQTVALEKYIPGRVPQIEFAKKYQPSLITFTGGGNDIGFANIMQYCASSVETCGYVKGRTATMHDDLMGEIDDQYLYTKLFIERLKQASPFSEIYVIGYPKFVSEELACGLNSALLDINERKLINESIDRLNTVTARAASDNGVKYFDITNALSGGQICEGSEYVTGFVDAWRESGMANDPNMFHPNAKGHAKIADAIVARKKVIDSGVLPTYPLVQPVSPTHKIIHQTVTTPALAKGSKVKLMSDKGTFKTGSEAQFVIHSHDIVLGNAHAESDGSVTWQGELPAALDNGYHLITISGVDGNDESTQVQQFVTIVSQVSSNGICDVIAHWFDETTGKDICAPISPSTGTIGENEQIKKSPTVGTLHLGRVNEKIELFPLGSPQESSMAQFDSQDKDNTVTPLDNLHTSHVNYGMPTSMIISGSVLLTIIVIGLTYAIRKKT